MEKNVIGVFVPTGNELLEIEHFFTEAYVAFLSLAKRAYYDFVAQPLQKKNENETFQKIYLSELELSEIEKKVLKLKTGGYKSAQVFYEVTSKVSALRKINRARRLLLCESYQACLAYLTGKLRSDDSIAKHSLFANRNFSMAADMVSRNVIGPNAKNHPKEDKLISLIASLASSKGGIIIFIDDKDAINCLSVKLADKFARVGVDTLFGKNSKVQRRETIEKFKSGKTKILLSTSVVESGLEPKNVRAIINYSMPLSDEYFKNRCEFISATPQEKFPDLYFMVMDHPYEKIVYNSFCKRNDLKSKPPQKDLGQFSLDFPEE